MTDDRFTDAQVQAGRVLLAQLTDLPILPDVPPACPSFAYMCASNLDALVIHERGTGWVADLFFKNVPEGYPDIIGTPDAHCFETYKTALMAGLLSVTSYRILPPPLLRGTGPYIAIGQGTPG